MKTRILVLLVVLVALPFTGWAQLTQIQRGQRGYTPPPRPQEEKARSVENTLVDIDAKMAIYETEFSLDAFEKAVMKNLIVDFENDKMAVTGDETVSYKDRLEVISKLQEKLATEMEIFLTKDEIARFGEMHFAENGMKRKIKDIKKESKEKRKRKKRKKNSDDG